MTILAPLWYQNPYIEQGKDTGLVFTDISDFFMNFINEIDEQNTI